MSGGVRYRSVSWRPPPSGDWLKQRLRDANARVLVYKPIGYRLLCSDKVAECLLKRVQLGTASDWVEQGSMDWKGYKKISDEILVVNAMDIVAAVEEETQSIVQPPVKSRVPRGWVPGQRHGGVKRPEQSDAMDASESMDTTDSRKRQRDENLKEKNTRS